MQFVFTQRQEYVTTIEFINSTPLTNVTNLDFYKEINLVGSFLSSQFRYSFDNITWSNYITLNQSNISSVDIRNNPNLYLDILYTRANINSANVDSFIIVYESSDLITPSNSSTLINADLFQNEQPSYYLNRENQFGPYSSLLVSNLLDASTVGVYYGRTDNSLGTSLFFKSIVGGGNISVIDNSLGSIILDTSIIQDVSINDLYSLISQKASKIYVDGSLLQLNSSLNFIFNTYITKNYVDGSLNQRDTSLNNLTTLINQKIDRTYVDSSLSQRDISLNFLFNTYVTKLYVDGSLNVKVNQSYVDASLLSRDNSLNSILNNYSTKLYVDGSLNSKANQSYVDGSLNLKSNLSYD